MRYVNLAAHILFSAMMGINTLLNGLMSLGTSALDSADSAMSLLSMVLLCGFISVFSLVCGIITFAGAKKFRTGIYIMLETINHGFAILLSVIMIINKITSWQEYLKRFSHPVARSAPSLSYEIVILAAGIACIIFTVIKAKSLKADKGQKG